MGSFYVVWQKSNEIGNVCEKIIFCDVTSYNLAEIRRHVRGTCSLYLESI